jgi:hypothetical protein
MIADQLQQGGNGWWGVNQIGSWCCGWYMLHDKIMQVYKLLEEHKVVKMT